jgi:hypothetical protein
MKEVWNVPGEMERKPIDVVVKRPEMDLVTLGQMLSKSGYFADAKDAAQAIVKVLAGAEVGLPPIASMTGIHIVKGKVTFAATTMAALIQRSGKYNYRPVEHTETVCELSFTEDGKVVGPSRFTMDDAQRAGLVSQNPTWKSYPKNMLFARAMSNGARWYCPSVFGGPVYTPDEVRHSDVEDMPEPAPPLHDVDAVRAAWDQAQKEASPSNVDDADRHRFLDVIDLRSRELGLTKREYKDNWHRYIGNVVTERAQIADLMALADYLATQIAAKKKAEAELAAKRKALGMSETPREPREGEVVLPAPTPPTQE